MLYSMTSTTYIFDLQQFKEQFVRDYYVEKNFDLNSAFSEYFQNFIQNNSDEYNTRLIIKFYDMEQTHKPFERSIHDFLYKKLYDIIVAYLQ